MSAMWTDLLGLRQRESEASPRADEIGSGRSPSAMRPARRAAQPAGTHRRRNRTRLPNLASQMRVAFSSMAWNTGSSSPGELEMTCSTSEVAVCCSSASVSSRVRACTSSNSRTFSIAITAWSAKVVTSSICFSVNGPHASVRGYDADRRSFAQQRRPTWSGAGSSAYLGSVNSGSVYVEDMNRCAFKQQPARSTPHAPA